MDEKPDPRWMVEVLRDLAAFALVNGFEASAVALKEAENLVKLEIEERSGPEGGFPERGDNFVVFSRDH
ncbi:MULTISPECIES: hypothetical protein [Mameliella]|uniref:hypothetical protein n=1 Tax=Mameliella TaxID=1434019 RepID=UPI001054E32C|nr:MULTISPECIES: hypothetical protein [Mameliella]MCR9272194.1 hypothetical protein [Paracoccaceae bacterium]